MNQICKVGKRTHQREREPVTSRFGDTNLVLHVMSQMRQCISLLQTTFGSDRFVTTGERNRLERKQRNLLGIIQREPNYRTDLVVVDSVYQRRDQDDLNTGLVQVVNCAQFHVKKVSYLPVTVRVVSNSIKLEVDIAQPSLSGLAAKLFALGEL